MRLADCKFSEYGGDPALEFAVRPGNDTTFALFDGQPTLFCESTQKLYALNSIAALIWCCLDEGGGHQVARARLVDAGIDRKSADQHVDQAIRCWLRLGLLGVDFGSRRRHACAFQIDGSTYSLETSSLATCQQISALFDPRSSRVDGDATAHFRIATAHFKVLDLDGSLHLFLEDRIIGSCEPDALAPTLKALVTAQVLARAREKIVFHAACLSHRGQALLISGAPGAGKTTLALQLAARGFGYCGDDIALIAPDASVTGLPFAPTVKSGAWEIVGEVWPELTTTPVHRRPDGKHVKYLRLDDIDPEPHPVGWIVFLRRESGASTRFVPLEAVDAMQRIIDGACSPTRQLSLASFRALRRMLAGAPAVELIYTGSAQAADAVCEFCNDQA